jgi:hypothetical protein
MKAETERNIESYYVYAVLFLLLIYRSFLMAIYKIRSKMNYNRNPHHNVMIQ